MAKKKKPAAAKGSAGKRSPPSRPLNRPAIPAAYTELREQFSQALQAGQTALMDELLAQIRATPKLSRDMEAMQLEAEITMLLAPIWPASSGADLEDKLCDRLEDLTQLIDEHELSPPVYGSLLLMRALACHRLGELDSYLADMEELESLFDLPLELRTELVRVRANAFMDNDEPKKALAEYEGLLAQPELSAEQRLDAMIDSVSALLDMGRQREARKRLQAVMADPAVTDHHRVGCLMYLPKTYDSAKDQLARWHEAINSGLLDAEARGSALYARHDLLLDAGDSAGALADLQAALAIPELAKDDRLACLMSLSGIYTNQKRFEDALAILDPLVEQSATKLPTPGSFPTEEEFEAMGTYLGARLPRATTYAFMGRFADARRDLSAMELYADMFPLAHEMIDEVRTTIEQMARAAQKETKPKRK